VVPEPAWVDPNLILNWQDVREFKMKIEGRNTGNMPTAGTYDVWKKLVPAAGSSTNRRDRYYVHSKMDANDIDTSAPLFWSQYSNESYFEMLRDAYGEKIQIAVVPSHRQAKFCRLFPNAEEVHVAIKQAAKDWWNGLTHQQKRALRWEPDVDADIAKWLSKVPIKNIKDETLREIVTLYRYREREKALVEKYRYKFSRLLDKKPITFEGLEERYPLLMGSIYDMPENGKDHALYYVNAVYEAEKGKVKV
jgi:hypothetical protein